MPLRQTHRVDRGLDLKRPKQSLGKPTHFEVRDGTYLTHAKTDRRRRGGNRNLENRSEWSEPLPAIPEQTRRNILAAATSEFAARGLEGGRTDRIAEQAGVAKRMLFHYFGSKEGLFQAVLEDNYAKIRSMESELELSSRSPEEAMVELVEFSFNWFLEHPEFVPLLNEANLHKGRHVPCLFRGAKADHASGGADRRCTETRRRSRHDAIRRRSGRTLHVDLPGPAYFTFSNRHTLGVIFDPGPDERSGAVASAPAYRGPDPGVFANPSRQRRRRGASMIDRIPTDVLAAFRKAVSSRLIRWLSMPTGPLMSGGQRALTRYYLDAGVLGVAVGVHTTQFEIRNQGMLRPVLQTGRRRSVDMDHPRHACSSPALCGPTHQAVAESPACTGAWLSPPSCCRLPGSTAISTRSSTIAGLSAR